MALLRKYDHSDIFDAKEIRIPVPKYHQFEKETGCYNVDVPDISQSFDGGSGIYNGPYRHRTISCPKEPTNLHSKCGVSTEQTCKNKQIDRSHQSNTPKTNDKKFPSPSKTEDDSTKEDNISSALLMESKNSSETQLLEFLKKQDAKLDAIQEQVSQALTPSQSSKCVSTSEPQNCDVGLLRTASNVAGGLSVGREDFLIRFVLSQSEQIQKLQEQVNWLMLNAAKSNALSVESSPNTLCKNSNALEGFLEKVSNQGDSTCREDAEVTKQSASTMTSMTFNGNEKLVIRKKMTVFTDSSKYQEEVSAQCSYIANAEASPRKETPRTTSSTQKSSKKSRKPSKSSPRCKCCLRRNSIGSESSNIDSPDKEKIQPSPIRSNSPSVKENLNVKANKNDNGRIAEKPEELPVKERKKATPKGISKKTTPKGILKPESTKSPLPKASPSQRTEKLVRPSSTSSNSSSDDSIHITPKLRKQRPAAALRQSERTDRVDDETEDGARYVFSSPNLSVATKEYLEMYGLVRNESKRKSGRYPNCM